MSVTLEKVQRSVSQRATDAIACLQDVLGLEDLKMLSTALAEVAAEEAQSNRLFAERVRVAYQDILATSKKKVSTKKKSAGPAKLTPIGSIEGESYSPYGEFNPRILYKLYGAEQFSTVLNEYPLSRLREAAELIMQQHPGTKPKSKSKKDDVIAYIIQHVTADNANN